MNQIENIRVRQAMVETLSLLGKFETAYERRPEHLRTDADRALIAEYRQHVAKLTDMLSRS